MKVSGFTFIRNAVKFDYPVKEAILSILPLCDEFIIALGDSEDDTEALLKSIASPKIKIIHTQWDDSLREGGRVLADETNKALQAVSHDADWAFYIQGDEVLHEKYHAIVKEDMQAHLNNPKVEGLLFNYMHFYGSYDYVGDSRKWYRREVRIIRRNCGASSFKDAQGFRINGRPLHVKKTEATMYHYGWVKPPEIQQQKQLNFNRYWHDDMWMEEKIPKVAHFDYSKIDSLRKFQGSHPEVMQNRVQQMNWHFSFDPSEKKYSWKKKILHYIEKRSGWRIGEFKNFRII